MIRGMRNISVRLWLSLMVAVPAGFYIMPWFSRFWSGPGIMGAFFCFSAMCYTGISVLLHLAGIWLIQKRIQEAEIWEQAGIPARAEKNFFRRSGSMIPFCCLRFDSGRRPQ